MLRCFHVDAFSPRVLAGNPAAVMPLDTFPPDATLHAIAREHNLSETAFVVEGERIVADHDADYALRWFTPEVEVDLCGHATLASALVVFLRLRPNATSVRFSTRSGVLVVERAPVRDRERERSTSDLNSEDGAAPSLRLRLLAPALFNVEADVSSPDLAPLLDALGIPRALEVRTGRDPIVRLESANAVALVAPDLRKLAALEIDGVIVTAPASDGAGVDFVSRYFAPGCGIDEDPVTGYAHCLLAPYWAERLGRDGVVGRQISRRPGEVQCTLVRDHAQAVTGVWLEGDATLYAESNVYYSLSTSGC